MTTADDLAAWGDAVCAAIADADSDANQLREKALRAAPEHPRRGLVFATLSLASEVRAASLRAELHQPGAATPPPTELLG